MRSGGLEENSGTHASMIGGKQGASLFSKRSLMMEDKRRDKRVSEENRVTITLFSKDRAGDVLENIYALTRDISLSGVKIQTDVKLPIDTLLKVDLVLAKSHKLISVIGKVKWINRLYGDEVFEIGVEFVDTPPARALAILEHLYGERKEKGNL